MFGRMSTKNFLFKMTFIITCWSLAHLLQNSLYNICPDAFTATEFSKILSRQLCQSVKILQPFRDWCVPIFRVLLITWHPAVWYIYCCGISVLYVLDIWFQLFHVSVPHIFFHIHLECNTHQVCSGLDYHWLFLRCW